MTTAPTTVMIFPNQPLYQGMWKFVCTAPQAEIVLEAVRKVIPNAEIYDAGQQLNFGLAIVYLDMITKFWGITGTDPAGNQIMESAAWLFDRKTQPLPMTDGEGGPNIHETPIPGTGMAQLSWGA